MMTQVDSAKLLQPDQLEPAVDLARRTLEQLDSMLLGQSQLHRLVLVGILSRGHVLLEGLPGVGKTAMISSLGQLLNLQFKRVQFTPDLMPGDIVGTPILQEDEAGRRQMIFEPGPVFTNILLADEINRASPKTQSALLEAMQERRVTSFGETRELPSPFFVLATQNPVELEGTYPLPEAQLDRFLFKLRVVGAEVQVMEQIINERRRGETPTPSWTMTSEQLQSLYDMLEQIYLPRPVARYIARLVAATHAGHEEANDEMTRYIHYGASPRAAIAMAEASRAHAFIEGRPTVGFEDVKAIAPAVINHRLILNYQARFDKVDAHDLVETLIDSVDEAGLDLPADVVVGSETSS